MKKIIAVLFTLMSFSVFAGLDKLVADYNGSNTSDDLVKSGWAANDNGRGHKILQIVVSDAGWKAEMYLDKTGKVVKHNRGFKGKADFDYDYQMTSTQAGWAEMGTGKNGPMYHMTPIIGKLSFKGPMKEAMGNMGPFAKFLVVIGSNIAGHKE